MKAPPRRGPATEAIPHIPPISPNAKGRLFKGTVIQLVSRTESNFEIWDSDILECDTMTTPPEKIPAVPIYEV